MLESKSLAVTKIMRGKLYWNWSVLTCIFYQTDCL